MKPYPLVSLNHLTVPVAMKTPPLPLMERAGETRTRNRYSLVYAGSVPDGAVIRAPFSISAVARVQQCSRGFHAVVAVRAPAAGCPHWETPMVRCREAFR